MTENVAFENSLTVDGRYRLLVQSITDYAIYMLDENGVVSSWNPGAERFKGYTEEEIGGQHFSRFYTEEDRARGLPALALETARTQGRFISEGWRTRKDGSSFWASVVIDPIRDKQQRLVGYAKITRDLTERLRAEDTLQKSEHSFRLLVQSVTDYAIYMLDPAGNITNWNSGARRIKGYTEEEVVGRHFSLFYTEEDRAEGWPARALQEAAATGRFEREGWRVRKDGSRFWASVVIDSIRTPSGELVGFAKVTRDVTERREAQLALDKARGELLQAQKMEAVGQLTGGLAHDFNNILAGIMGSLEMMSTRIAQGRIGDLDRYLTSATGAARRASALTQRLLAFSRRQTLDPRPTDINRLVQGMLDLINKSVGPEIAVESAGAAGLWITLIDAVQLESALLNLCINARDAMPDGGKITIETSNRWMDDRTARERDLAPGQYVSLCVSDTGTGMTPDVKARAFDPFYTTKPIGQGTGLGLSMVYGFAGQSGGAVRIYSEVGHGTMVCIYLPRHHGESDGETIAAPTEAPPALGRETVLVVDDEPLIRVLAVEQLQELGYYVLEAGDAASALRILQSDRHVHLLVTDVGLPNGMNGRQLADAAQSLHRNLKVLFITGYAENAVINHGHLSAGMQVLTKPFQMEELGRKVRELISATAS